MWNDSVVIMVAIFEILVGIVLALSFIFLFGLGLMATVTGFDLILGLIN